MINYKNILIRCCHLLLVFFIILCPCLLLSDFSAIYDAQYYWETAYTISTDSGFNILEYPYTFRGYFLPTFHLFLQVFAEYISVDPFIILYIYLSLFTAITIVFSLPTIFNISFRTKQYYIATVIQSALFIYNWNDIIVHPLSDLPAMLYIISAMLFAKLFVININKRFIYRILSLFACGLSMYIAYNIRAVYIYSAILIVGYILSCTVKHVIHGKAKHEVFSKNTLLNLLKNVSIAIITLAIGVTVFAIPQGMINYKYTGDASPRITTERFIDQFYPTYTGDLQMRQVYWGIFVPRYETYTGDPGSYASPAVRFYDKAGMMILGNEEITAENFTYSKFFDLIFKYPLEVVAIYSRHIVSALTPIFSEAYVSDLFENKYFRIILNISLWIISAIIYFSRSERYNEKSFFKKNWYVIIALIFSCFLTLAGAIEIRFFIIVHFLMYFYITNLIDVKALLGYLKVNWLKTAIISGTVFLLWLSVVSGILANVENSILIF